MGDPLDGLERGVELARAAGGVGLGEQHDAAVDGLEDDVGEHGRFDAHRRVVQLGQRQHLPLLAVRFVFEQVLRFHPPVEDGKLVRVHVFEHVVLRRLPLDRKLQPEEARVVRDEFDVCVEACAAGAIVGDEDLDRSLVQLTLRGQSGASRKSMRWLTGNLAYVSSQVGHGAEARPRV